MLTQKEVEKIVYYFLKRYPDKIRYNEEYFGELITEAHLALQKFNPSLGFKPSCLIIKYCSNRLNFLIRRDKRFYEKHMFNQLVYKYAAEEFVPYYLSVHQDYADFLSTVNLSKRTREVLGVYLDNPDETLKQLGKRLNISGEAVRLQMKTAKERLAIFDARTQRSRKVSL